MVSGQNRYFKSILEELKESLNSSEDPQDGEELREKGELIYQAVESMSQELLRECWQKLSKHEKQNLEKARKLKQEIRHRVRQYSHPDE